MHLQRLSPRLAVALLPLLVIGCTGEIPADSTDFSEDELRWANCSVTPSEPVVDESFSIQVSRLRPNRRVRVLLQSASGEQSFEGTADSNGNYALETSVADAGDAKATVFGYTRRGERAVASCSFYVSEPDHCNDWWCADSGPVDEPDASVDAMVSEPDAMVSEPDAMVSEPDAAVSEPDASVPGDHPFPFGFNDQQFFANVSAHAPTRLQCGDVLADRSITQYQEPAAINNYCGSGTTTVRRVRLGGDLGANGDVREGYRCGGTGTMNIESSWLEAKGMGDDHADVIQCYDPNNSPTATMNIRNTTIRAYNSSATAGLFVADSYALDLTLEDVLFWGGPFGLRFHTDGRPGSISLNNVCFYGKGASDHSFAYEPYLFNPYPPDIVQWNNVYWCTIENGTLVKHGSIAKPY